MLVFRGTGKIKKEVKSDWLKFTEQPAILSSANLWTSFYIIGTSIMKELMATSFF